MIELLGEMRLDNDMYWPIMFLANSLCDREFTRAVTNEQKEDIAQKILKLAQDKMPTPDGICHKGYIVAIEAQIARFRPNVDKTTWDTLVSRGKAIPNIADKVFVLEKIALAMLVNDMEKALGLLEEARVIADSIPAQLDRYEHYTGLASTAYTMKQMIELTRGKKKGGTSAKKLDDFARKCLGDAMTFSIDIGENDQTKLQQEVVDLAYNIDPNLAASLIEQTDNDIGRKEARMMLTERLDTFKTRDKLANDQEVDEKAFGVHAPSAAWKALGAMNAYRVTAKKWKGSSEMLNRSGKMTLGRAYPIYAFLLATYKKLYGHDKKNAYELQILFEATMKIVSLVEKLVGYSTVCRVDRCLSATLEKSVVDVGERETALVHITKWIAENANDYIKICDPYIGPDELNVIADIISLKPDSVKVFVLTSISHNRDKNSVSSYKEAYRNHWKYSVSNQEPPDIAITIAGRASDGVLPIHDRWIITKDKGLRIGTSLNSIGERKLSCVSEMNKEETAEIEAVVDKYIRSEELYVMGERVDYDKFRI